MVSYENFDLNVFNVLVAEFRRSIRPAIPHIIAFLSHGDFNDCRAGADALSKLSEQCNIFKFSELNIVDVLFLAGQGFLASISATIPLIITFLESRNSDVCATSANALVKLSEQSKV